MTKQQISEEFFKWLNDPTPSTDEDGMGGEWRRVLKNNSEFSKLLAESLALVVGEFLVHQDITKLTVKTMASLFELGYILCKMEKELKDKELNNELELGYSQTMQ